LIVPNRWGAIKDTGVPIAELRDISSVINTIEPSFKAHPQIKKFYELRYKAIAEDTGIDFATAEALAFGALLKEGYGIRLSG
jgi:2-oxoglutarate dehydrogenase E1 component